MCFCTGMIFTLFEFFSNVIVCSIIKPKGKRKKGTEKVELIAVCSLGCEHPVTVQLYAVSVKLYFRIEWIVDPKCY